MGRRCNRAAPRGKNAAVPRRQDHARPAGDFLAQADEAFNTGDVVAAHKLASKAFSIDESFTPAALRLVKYYQNVGKRRAALKTIERAFARKPHPDLADLWLKAVPETTKTKTPSQEGKDLYEWAKKLFSVNPDHRDAQRMMGTAAMEAKLWREARELLRRAGDHRMLARLERPRQRQ